MSISLPRVRLVSVGVHPHASNVGCGIGIFEGMEA